MVNLDFGEGFAARNDNQIQLLLAKSDSASDEHDKPWFAAEPKKEAKAIA